MFLYQPLNGYCYNSDTHLLYYFVIENLKQFKNVKGELLDIGSGSGILGLLICRDFKRLFLNQCEVQSSFQTLTSINAKNNHIEHQLFKGDFVQHVFKKQFDICVSNPPFYSSRGVKSSNNNIAIARYNDNLPLERLIKKAHDILVRNGKFFFCYDVKQINDIILLLNKYGFNLEAMQFVHPSIDKKATLVLLYARKDSKAMTNILNPLIVFENKEFSRHVQDIYNKASTYSIKVDI